MKILVALVAMTFATGCTYPQHQRNISSPGPCDVEITIDEPTYSSAGFIVPHLITHGPTEIYIPWPDGFRVEKAEGNSRHPPEHTESTGGNQEASRPPPLIYRFEKPMRLAIVWRDVAQQATEDEFTVPPGRYRMALTFTIGHPARANAPPVAVCTIYSPLFELVQEEHIVRFD